jgi:hypothetical protein
VCRSADNNRVNGGATTATGGVAATLGWGIQKRWVLNSSLYWRYLRLHVKVLRFYLNLPSAGELPIAARRTRLSRVSDVRRGVPEPIEPCKHG